MRVLVVWVIALAIGLGIGAGSTAAMAATASGSVTAFGLFGANYSGYGSVTNVPLYRASAKTDAVPAANVSPGYLGHRADCTRSMLFALLAVGLTTVPLPLGYPATRLAATAGLAHT